MELDDNLIETAVETPEPTLREELEAAHTEVVESRQRDEQGRFAAKAKEEADALAEKPEAVAIKPAAQVVEKPVAEVPAAPERPTLAPNAWSATAKAAWVDAHPALKAEISKREADIHREFTRQDAERNLGKQFQQITQPYAALIQSEGGSPVKAFQQYLETTRLLRTGDAATKVQLVRAMCQQFNIDMSGQKTQAQQQLIDPNYQNLHNEVAQLKAERQQAAFQAQQQETSRLQSQIDTFAADPANIHFEAVKPHMVALLNGGQAANLQEAYDQALWARPDIRSTLLDQQLADREAKRVADKKLKADAARRAGGSVIGSPGLGATTDPQAGNRSLRQELEAALGTSRV